MTNPVGTVVILHRGVVSTPLLHWVRTLPPSIVLNTQEGNEIARQRNLGAHAGLAGEWVLFCDSDSIPRVDSLPSLLSRNLPIVGAVICMRTPPWQIAAVDLGRTMTDLKKVDLLALPRTGVREVATVGTGFMLVRRPVFEAVRFPWFQCGQIVADMLHEDSGFCLRAAKAGIRVWLDCEARVGHDFGGGTVWPGRDGRPWIEWKGANRMSEPFEATPSRVEPALETA